MITDNLAPRTGRTYIYLDQGLISSLRSIKEPADLFSYSLFSGFDIKMKSIPWLSASINADLNLNRVLIGVLCAFLDRVWAFFYFDYCLDNVKMLYSFQADKFVS